MTDPQASYLESKQNLGALQKQSALTIASWFRLISFPSWKVRNYWIYKKPKISLADYNTELNRLLAKNQIPPVTAGYFEFTI